MPHYIIRNIDRKVWQDFKQRAESEGRQLRWILLELIQRYIRDGLAEKAKR